MCRLFGFRSVIPSQVHSSLVAAENALGVQSNAHPDGWGVAFYVDGAPHVTRSPMTALSDALFHRLSGVVAAETVLAHVRQATQGANNVLNCHPFQYGRWVGAHNGDIPNFEFKRSALLAEIAPRLRRFVLGDTDSELVFFQFLSRLSEYGPLGRTHAAKDIVASLKATMDRVREICDDENHRSLLTLMVTDGQCLVAVQGGKPLFYSTYKRKCPERDSCSSLSAECEGPTKTGYVNHFIISSERLQGENVWVELAEGDVMAVDHRMQVFSSHVGRVDLPVLGTPSVAV
jgi:predicted glutamine amidotransferase